MNYRSRPWLELAFFLSFAVAVWLRPTLTTAITRYVAQSWAAWLLGMLAAYVAARYLFPWLARKGLEAASRP